MCKAPRKSDCDPNAAHAINSTRGKWREKEQQVAMAKREEARRVDCAKLM